MNTQIKEHRDEVLNYITSKDEFWVDVEPLLKEMMVSFKEFYDILDSLVNDNLIEPHQEADYGKLRLTFKDEPIYLVSPLLFRAKSNNMATTPHANQPIKADVRSKFLIILSKYWWLLIIPIIGALIALYLWDKYSSFL